MVCYFQNHNFEYLFPSCVIHYCIFFSSSFLSITVHREIECHSYKLFPFTIYLFMVLLYLFIAVQIRTWLVEKMFSVLLFQQNSQCSTHRFNILIVSSLYICYLKAGNVLLILAQQEKTDSHLKTLTAVSLICIE